MIDIFKKPLADLEDTELLDVLGMVSDEVKRRNKLMSNSDSPEKLVKSIVEAMSKPPR